MTHDAKLILRGLRHGARHNRKIIQEARRAGIRIADAYSLVEGESEFRNIFGHDWGSSSRRIPFPGARVTKSRALALYDFVKHGGTSNGVGLTQLTYSGFLEEAVRAGGLHRPRIQLRIGFLTLAGLQRTHGRQGGFQHYNGEGPAAVTYGINAMKRAKKWHGILYP